MATIVVRYKVKPDRVDENRALIEAVFAELAATDPGGIHYESLQLEDGVSFVHIASIATDDGHNPLGAITAFGEFTRDIGERCTEPPAAVTATVLGSYGVTT